MPQNEAYRMTSYEFPGYGAVIAGNFVEIGPSIRGFFASVQAYHWDPNTRHENFDTIEAAVAWAAETANTHRGEPNRKAQVDAWEIVDGCSIAARRLESGEYESDWRPMRVNCDAYPYLNDRQNFPTSEAALNEAREQARQWTRQDREHEETLLNIKAALEQAANN